MGLESDVLLDLIAELVGLLLFLLLLLPEPLDNEAGIGPCIGHSASGLVKKQMV